MFRYVATFFVILCVFKVRMLRFKVRMLACKVRMLRFSPLFSVALCYTFDFFLLCSRKDGTN